MFDLPMRASTSLAILLLTVGCSSTTSKLRTRFAKEHSCSVDETRVIENGGNSYRASGCGKSVEYVCPGIGSMGDAARECEESGLHKNPGAEPKPLPGAYPMAPPQPPGPTRNDP
jgi:hypothetical protein